MAGYGFGAVGVAPGLAGSLHAANVRKFGAGLGGELDADAEAGAAGAGTGAGAGGVSQSDGLAVATGAFETAARVWRWRATRTAVRRPHRSATMTSVIAETRPRSPTTPVVAIIFMAAYTRSERLPLTMMHRLPTLLVLAACLAPVPAAAQAKPTDVYVSVVDSKGAPVEGLGVGDFTVREDNVAREVLKVGPATEPLTVALLIDDSQAANEGIQMIRDGVRNFVRALDGKAEIALVTFGERPTILVDYTTDQKRLDTAIGRLFPRPGGGAYLLEAIVEVSKGLQKREAKRPVMAVLMLEDVEFSNRYYQQVLTELDKSRAAMHVVSIGQPGDSSTDELRNRNMVVAEGTARTGGRRDQLLAISATPEKMKQLANELLKQYVVTYARPETLIPPEKIAVSVTKPGLTARARTRALANK